MNKESGKVKTLLAVLLLVFAIFSVSFTSLESNHDCKGNDCLICYVIQVAENNLQLLKIAVAFTAATHLFLQSKKITLKILVSKSTRTATLVSNKIRIND